jgi:antitoxin (DNA-binding transcriptional repressor) of toxin-antitoxin stability system
MYHMKPTASLRDLRNGFPEVRRRLEAEGEVLVTERGKPRYRLTLYEQPLPAKSGNVDYWSRLSGYQPSPIAREQSRKLHDENRSER